MKLKLPKRNILLSISFLLVKFSLFGNQHQYYNCKKIFYTGENVAPPLGYCQWSFSFDYLDDVRNYRLPHYLLYDGYYELAEYKFSVAFENNAYRPQHPGYY